MNLFLIILLFHIQQLQSNNIIHLESCFCLQVECKLNIHSLLALFAAGVHVSPSKCTGTLLNWKSGIPTRNYELSDCQQHGLYTCVDLLRLNIIKYEMFIKAQYELNKGSKNAESAC